MVILSKGCKPNNFESHNSLKLSFTKIQGLSWDFVDCESFLELKGLSSFNLKRFYYSYAWSRSFCEGKTSFCMGLISRKLRRLLLMFLTGFTSFSVLLLFPLSITFFVFMHNFLFCFI